MGLRCGVYKALETSRFHDLRGVFRDLGCLTATRLRRSAPPACACQLGGVTRVGWWTSRFEGIEKGVGIHGPV